MNLKIFSSLSSSVIKWWFHIPEFGAVPIMRSGALFF